MKLRLTKKVIKNWKKGVDYPSSILNNASKKYRPYLVRSCNKFNDTYKDMGVITIPFVMRETIYMENPNYIDKRFLQ